MSTALAAYLGPIDLHLLTYLDATQDLALVAVERLYQYGVALLQGLVRPEHVLEDWDDFFYLAGGFVFAYGSQRLGVLARASSVLWTRREPGPLSGWDQMLLVDLTREVGEHLCARRNALGSGR